MISSPPEFAAHPARPEDAEAVLELVPPELGFGLDDIRTEWRRTDLERDTHTNVQVDFLFIRDDFRLDLQDPLVEAFQQAYEAISGTRLSIGAKPFIVPAMGSHGGATADGQRKILKGFGIAGVVSSMDVVQLGPDAFIDRCAFESDGVILIPKEGEPQAAFNTPAMPWAMRT